MRKIRWSAPWSVPGGQPLGLGFRNALFPSWWRLSPLFYQDGQIFRFPAPINHLGVLGDLSTRQLSFPARNPASSRTTLLGGAWARFVSSTVVRLGLVVQRQIEKR